MRHFIPFMTTYSTRVTALLRKLYEKMLHYIKINY